jgi:pyruvate dehydrogenase E2 component (dihydrolipoamide acetyltransferase)
MSTALEVRVPDIGDFKDIPVIEVLVHPGDSINPEDPLVTLESDKATMEVPSPAGGTVKELKVKVGDKVSQGSLVLLLESAAEEKSTTAPAAASVATVAPTEAAPAPAPTPTAQAPIAAAVGRSDPAPVATRSPPPPLTAPAAAVDEVTFAAAHASPVVRRFARELGVELGKVQGSGPRGRILKEDVPHLRFTLGGV